MLFMFGSISGMERVVSVRGMILGEHCVATWERGSFRYFVRGKSVHLMCVTSF